MKKLEIQKEWKRRIGIRWMDKTLNHWKSLNMM